MDPENLVLEKIRVVLGCNNLRGLRDVQPIRQDTLEKRLEAVFYKLSARNILSIYALWLREQNTWHNPRDNKVAVDRWFKYMMNKGFPLDRVLEVWTGCVGVDVPGFPGNYLRMGKDTVHRIQKTHDAVMGHLLKASGGAVLIKNPGAEKTSVTATEKPSSTSVESQSKLDSVLNAFGITSCTLPYKPPQSSNGKRKRKNKKPPPPAKYDPTKYDLDAIQGTTAPPAVYNPTKHDLDAIQESPKDPEWKDTLFPPMPKSPQKENVCKRCNAPGKPLKKVRPALELTAE